MKHSKIFHKKDLLKRKKARDKIKSIDSRSLLVRFNIAYFVFSIVPVAILVFLFYQYDANSREIKISEDHFSLLILLVSLGCLVSFFGVRNALRKLLTLSSRLKEYLFGELDKETVLELAREEGEVAELARAFGDILGRLENNIKELKRTKKVLNKILFSIGKALSSVQSFNSLIRLTLEAVAEALGALRGAVYLFDVEKSLLELCVSIGLSEDDIPRKVDLDHGPLGWVIKERKSLFLPLLEKDEEENELFSPSLICTPLISQDNILGVVVLSGKDRKSNFSEDDVRILSNLSAQIAVAIKNAKLNVAIEKTYFDTISALVLAVEAKDRYSKGHSERVSGISVKIAKKLGLNKDEIETLRGACILHDIGKIGIEDKILQKADKLSSQEIKIMHKHPLVGANIIKPLESFKNLLKPILQHHEKLDGSGYPQGLKGDEISFIARIICVADIFDALVTSRPYRKALSHKAAIKKLDNLADSGKIDIMLVNTLKEVI